MKMDDLRKKGDVELLAMMQELQLENMKDRGNLVGGGYDHQKHCKLRENRQDIARIKTILRQRKI